MKCHNRCRQTPENSMQMRPLASVQAASHRLAAHVLPIDAFIFRLQLLQHPERRPHVEPQLLSWYHALCAHAARAMEPLLKPTMPSAMHVCEDPCEDIATRLPITPSPPTSSSSCCPNRDSSGLGSTRSGSKVIGSVNRSICLHSEAGTVKSPVELRIQDQHPLQGRETGARSASLAYKMVNVKS